MFGSALVHVAIGLCLFILLVSLLCSGIREAGEIFRTRRIAGSTRCLSRINSHNAQQTPACARVVFQARTV